MSTPGHFSFLFYSVLIIELIDFFFFVMFKNIFFQKHEIKYRQAVLFFNTLKALVFSETPHHKCSVTMMWCQFHDELCDATLPEHIVGIVTALYRFLSTSYKREADLIKIFFSVNSLSF